MEVDIKDIKICYDRKNNTVPQYVHYRSNRNIDPYLFYHNLIWEDEFTIDGFHNSRSSVYISIVSVNTAAKYYMRWWSMKDLLKNAVLNKGVFKGLFTMKHAWDYTTVVMFDPSRLKDKPLAGPNWWDYAQPWEEEQ